MKLISPLRMVIFAFASTVCAANFTIVQADDKPLHYLVDLSDAKNHYVSVTLTMDVDQPETELMMAVWTPGSYLVRD